MGLGFRSNGVSDPDAYARRAYEAECALAASTSHGRNDQLNRSAYAVGQLVGAGVIDRTEAEHGLFTAAQASGYVAKDGAPAARSTIKSGLDQGMHNPREGLNGPRREAQRQERPAAGPKPRQDNAPLPTWTEPGADERPKFYAIGAAEPTIFPDEARRHLYWRDGQCVRAKIKKQSGVSLWSDVYRVRRPVDGAIGWQAKKPSDFEPVAYIGPQGTPDPFGPECAGRDIVWAEGEKDVDAFRARDVLAFTFGSASDVPDCGDLLAGRKVILCADRDPAGDRCIAKRITVLTGKAASLRTVLFHEFDKEGFDASDFFDAGHSAADFLARAKPVTAAESAAAAEPEEGKPAPRTLPVVDVASFHGKEVPARLWHVQDMIPVGTVTMLGGDGATGKSLLAAQLAASTALGRSWLGFEVRRGPVLFLTAEDDLDELHRRLDAVLAESGTYFNEVSGFKVMSLAGEDAVLGAFDGRANVVRPTPLFEAVQAHVQATKPVLVVLDTLSDLFGGDENQRTQARQFIGLLRGLAVQHKLALLLLSHPSLSGMSSGSGMSGSTAWNNSVRSRLYFERVKGDDGSEADPDARVLRVMKANYAQKGAETRVRWQAGVFVNTEAKASSFSAVAAQDRADSVFLDLLAAYETEGRPVCQTPSANYAPSKFGADPRAHGITTAGFAKAMNRLFAAGTIRGIEYGPNSRRRKKIVRC